MSGIRAGSLALLLVSVAAAPAALDVGYSTYLGGSNSDRTAGDQVTDANGNLYIAGNTQSTNFPVTSGAFDTTHNGGSDGFVMKLDPQGRIIWATYLGTGSRDELYGIKLDSQGNVVVAGACYGPGAPTTSGALQQGFAGGARDGFAAKLSADGSSLLWATYVGTSGGEIIRGMVLDSSDNLLLATGSDANTAWPSTWTSGRFQSSPQGGQDSVIIKLRSDGAQVLWATYVGGSADELGSPNVAVDGSDRVYLLSHTQSTDIPTTAGAYDRTHNGGTDVYIAEFSADGRNMIFGTYLGSSQDDGAGGKRGIEIDPNGDVVVTVWTRSANFPTTPGAFRSQPIEFTPWGATGATAKLSTSGALLASTYYGSSEGVSVDPSGNIYVGALTTISNFPVTPNAYQGTYGGNEDGVVCMLSPDLTTLLYATYLGGSGQDTTRMTWVHPDGTLYVFGTTTSTDFPVWNAPQPNYAGGTDIFIVKLTPSSTGSPALSVGPSGGLSSSGPQGGPFSPASMAYTVTNTGTGSMDWTASGGQPWVSVAPSGGTLAGGANATMTVSINAGANGLAAGSHADTILFTNVTSGTGSTARPVDLAISGTGPTVTFSSPPPSTTSTSPLVVSGTASGGTITGVTWINAATGQSGTASGTSTWTATIPLAAGANGITITVYDSSGNSTAQSFTVTYTPGGAGGGGGSSGGGGCGALGLEAVLLAAALRRRKGRR